MLHDPCISSMVSLQLTSLDTAGRCAHIHCTAGFCPPDSLELPLRPGLFFGTGILASVSDSACTSSSSSGNIRACFLLVGRRAPWRTARQPLRFCPKQAQEETNTMREEKLVILFAFPGFCCVNSSESLQPVTGQGSFVYLTRYMT